MTITNAQIQLLVSPNAYDTVHLPTTHDPYWPQPQDSRDFFVPDGSSFQPSDWMLERGPPVVAFLYWDLAISHDSRMLLDIFYHYYINPPPDSGFPLHIYRLIDPPGVAHRGVPSGRIYSNCPAQLSPTPLPPLDPFDTNIRAHFKFSHLIYSDDDFEKFPSVTFFSNEDCPGGGGGGPVRTPTVQPTLLTQVDAASVRLGKAFRDEAILSGGSNPRGTITFTLYDPDNIVVQTATVPVSGNGGYASPPYTPTTKTGVYRYKAHYSGDGVNKVADSALGAIHEDVLVVSTSAARIIPVPTMLNIAQTAYTTVPTMLNISPIHPGISRNPITGGPRVWYERTEDS